ncbi:hypothetical protein P7K49_034078, partial [Saguinus oedipus]
AVGRLTEKCDAPGKGFQKLACKHFIKKGKQAANLGTMPLQPALALGYHCWRVSGQVT